MPEARTREATATRTLRVLLLEDSENDAMLLRRELRRGGYEPVLARVHTPEGMKEAWRAAEAGGRPFHVVISDLRIPDCDGIELCRALQPPAPAPAIDPQRQREAWALTR